MGLESIKTDGKNASSESRKIKKPLIEKQRRKRINDSLHELKRLVLEALNRDTSLYEKMEKADVLDLTVNYLKSVQSAQQQAKNTTGLASYQAGFRECQDHMTRVLITDPTINANEKSQIISHIASSRPVMTLHQPHPIQNYATNSPTYLHFTTTPPPSPIPSPTARPGMSPIEGLTLLSRTAELKPNRRLSYNEISLSDRTDSVWRPWQNSGR